MACENSDIDVDKKQTRVILWATRRSASTPFYRAITQNDKIKTLYQLFRPAFFHGPERFSDYHITEASTSENNVTFSDVLRQYHGLHEGYEAVFSKEMAYSLRGRLNDSSYFPKGYTHTFLIRHPATVLESNYRINLQHYGAKAWSPYFVAYEELHQIFKLVCAESDNPPLVIDADDLIDNPERMLREYCRRTKLPYVSRMIHWKTTDLSIVPSDQYTHMYQKALIDTNSFERPAIDKQHPVKLPKVVEDCIEQVLPIYNDLYERRLRLEDCAPL